MFEDGMKWMMKKNGNERNLDPVPVEKWFGANCSVLADDLRPVASNEREAAMPVLMFDFVHGGSQAVKQTAVRPIHLGENRVPLSSSWPTRLAGLPRIREAGPSGRPEPESP